MSSAGLSALGRSTFIYPPNSIYYAAMVLALVGAVPLWLTIYPDLWPSTKTVWRTPYGLTCAGALAGLVCIYIVGAWEGLHDARTLQKNTEWAQSYLHYYPALDYHEFYLFPREGFDHFNEFVLPNLIRHNAAPSYIDPTPFTIGVPITFAVQDRNDMDLIAAGPDAVQLVTRRPDPYIIFKPFAPIAKKYIVSFTVETSAPANMTFYWNDGRGWSEERSITIDRRGQLATENSGYFPEADAGGRRRNVEAIALKVVDPASPSLTVIIRNRKVWTR
ncbi:MAG: hypothetical protein HYR55_10120 [Acidobacteria bacterium]|nr:hypothetical protein [Acidobacteriota bacterium]MBI3658331.1 hypothetical protein [Acidobacteriota bacterium]